LGSGNPVAGRSCPDGQVIEHRRRTREILVARVAVEDNESFDACRKTGAQAVFGIFQRDAVVAAGPFFPAPRSKYPARVSCAARCLRSRSLRTSSRRPRQPLLQQRGDIFGEVCGDGETDTAIARIGYELFDAGRNGIRPSRSMAV